MPGEVWFGFYTQPVRHSTSKGPNRDQGFLGQSFVQTYTKKNVTCARELQREHAVVPEDGMGNQGMIRENDLC